jgi:hypothetical protein
MTESGGLPVALVRAPLRAFVEIPLETGAPFDTAEIQRLEWEESTDGSRDGLLVKLQLWSGEIHIYFEPQLRLTEDWFQSDPGFVHMTLGGLHPVEFDRRSFSVDSRTVDVDLSFTERDGRTIALQVHHRSKRPATGMFTPATRQQRPFTLRLLYMEHFRMLPRRSSTIEFQVDGESIRLRPFLLPGRLATHWSARAAGMIVMASCNGSPGWTDKARVGDDRGWLQASFEAEDHFGSADSGSSSGTFRIAAPVGVVTTGRWVINWAGDERDVRLTDVRQNWFPGWSRPAALALWAARRTRRRGQRWSWRGRFWSDSDDQSNHDGGWTVESA